MMPSRKPPKTWPSGRLATVSRMAASRDSVLEPATMPSTMSRSDGEIGRISKPEAGSMKTMLPDACSLISRSSPLAERQQVGECAVVVVWTDEGEVEPVAPQDFGGDFLDILDRDGVDQFHHVLGRLDLAVGGFLAADP